MSNGYRVIVATAILAWVGAGWWLERKLDFPDSFGFSCSGSGCLTIEVWRSSVLLQHSPSGYDIALFVWLWSFPAAVLAVFAILALRRLRAAAQENRP